jgi:hypothetical protein
MTRRTNCYRQSCISLLVVAVVNIVLHINHSNLFGSSIHVSTYTTHRLPKTDEQYTTTIVTAFFPIKKSKPLVAKSLGGTARAPVLGIRAWDHSSGPNLGPELERELRTVRV